MQNQKNIFFENKKRGALDGNVIPANAPFIIMTDCDFSLFLVAALSSVPLPERYLGIVQYHILLWRNLSSPVLLHDNVCMHPFSFEEVLRILRSAVLLSESSRHPVRKMLSSLLCEE